MFFSIVDWKLINKNDYPNSLLYLRKSYWQQMGGISRIIASGIHRRVSLDLKVWKKSAQSVNIYLMHINKMWLIGHVHRSIIRMCCAGSSQLFFSWLCYEVLVAYIFSFLFQWCFGCLGTEEILLQEDAIVSCWPHWKTSELRTIRKVMY